MVIFIIGLWIVKSMKIDNISNIWSPLKNSIELKKKNRGAKCNISEPMATGEESPGEKALIP